MTVNMNDLNHVLKLSHLSIPEEDKENYLTQLQATLLNMKSLDDVDLTGIEPSSYSTVDKQYLRPDVAKNSDDLFLENNAPHWEDGYFSVPKISGDA
jgi:aspartyl-tRNA(Asn)/glutamyl-tRNA(Gln) amidotransferase subunit C